MMTNYESSASLLYDVAISHVFTTAPRVGCPDRHNLDTFLAFVSCFGFWLLVTAGLLIANRP